MKKIFLFFLQIYLREYNTCAKRLDEAKNKREKGSRDLNMTDDEINELIRKESEEMKSISQTFDTFSMGIEHIFREFGQLYEAHESENPEKNPYKKLPEVMADLVLLGYPLEIMDGNVSHVPLTWLNSVFDEIEKRMGENNKVSVTSVIGIQSTGKSTLLNTMFGSQFAVSSGRCTKGVFLQFLPLKDELRKALKCDYVFHLSAPPPL